MENINKDLKFMAAFAAAFLTEVDFDDTCSHETIDEFKDIVKDLMSYFTEDNAEDTQGEVLVQFIQAYNNLKEITAAYNDVEYC